MAEFHVDPDIRRARTLDARVYGDASIFERVKDVFARSWQLVGNTTVTRVPQMVNPVVMLPGFLDEPLVLSRDASDEFRVLSNVCTHRGAIVCEGAGRCATLRCRYHGRRFDLDGSFRSMPEFESTEDFPSPSDNLSVIDSAVVGPWVFASLEATTSFEDVAGPMMARCGHLGLRGDDLTFDASRSRDYLVQANWALYCENYMEGFHIPYVHASLNEVVEYETYETTCHDHSILQTAKSSDNPFGHDANHPDHGVAAYYWWLFPNTMVNIYPWGVSINVVKPLAPDRTKVSFETWVRDPARLDQGAGSGLDRVEREDEAVVESVQIGVRSRSYRHGRFSPTREQGVHHFQRLLASALSS